MSNPISYSDGTTALTETGNERTCAIVPAAGSGVRMGADRPKQFLGVGDKPILVRTLEAVLRVERIDTLCLVVPRDFMDRAAVLVEGLAIAGKTIQLVEGGRERQESVMNGLRQLPEDCRWVVIHDGVRPFASPALFEATWRAAREHGGAIAALSATDTVKRARDGLVTETLPREEIVLVQTPQVFRHDLILSAHEECRRRGWSVTDDASLFERLGLPVAVVEGERTNVKITTPEDLAWAEWFVGRKPH